MAKTDTKPIDTENEQLHTSEAEYTVHELAMASDLVFGKDVSPDCVVAALRVAGVEKATKSKAKQIVSEFLKKEVK